MAPVWCIQRVKQTNKSWQTHRVVAGYNTLRFSEYQAAKKVKRCEVLL